MNTYALSGLGGLLEWTEGLLRRAGLDLLAVRREGGLPAEQAEMLHHLLDLIEADPDRTFFGRLLTREWYHKATSWPGRVLSLPLNNNPAPILFICGLPRSGTTFANDLLAADPRLRILRHSDLEIDLPRAKATLEWLFKEGSAPIEAVHPLSSPPEDLQVMGQYVLADMLMGVYGAEYLVKLPEPLRVELFHRGYAFEREVYRRLPIRPDQRFVIKSPIIHMMFFEAFQASFDDYRMMILVRDVPTSALNSCHIFEVGMKYLKGVDPTIIGPLLLTYMEGYVSGLERLSASQRGKFAFVDFGRFVRDPVAALEKVYPWLGLELSSEVRASLRLRQAELERVHVSKVQRPPPEYYHLDMDAVRGLERRYAAVFEGRLW